MPIPFSDLVIVHSSSGGGGFPGKVVNITKSFYQGSHIAVKVDGALSDFFDIHSGVRQGCILSPLLFGFVMKSFRMDLKGIEWVDGKTLSDINFADDIALLHDTWNGMQAMISSLHEEAMKVALVVNTAKTKIMRVGNWTSAVGIRVEPEKPNECIFCYDGGCDREIAIRLGKATVHLDGWGESGQVETFPLK